MSRPPRASRSVALPCPCPLFTPQKELRIQDYLTAYQATARPPAPCPQSPDTPNARAALGLAPLFVPTAVPVPVDTLSATNTANAPAALPANHEFRPTKSTVGSERFESLAAQTPYSHFSHEVGFPPRTIGAIIIIITHTVDHQWQPRFFLLGPSS